MKKILALFLAITILFTLSACAKTTESGEGISTQSNGNETAPNSKDEYSEETEQTSTPNNEKIELSFAELVVVDNDDCMIKVTGIDEDSWLGFSLKVELENKSSDKNYMFSIDESSINGVAVSALLASEVSAGKKANDEITFYDDDADAELIGEFTDIELTFSVSDSDDWSADDIYSGSVHIYPYGEQNATTFVRTAQPEDQILVDNEQITVIVTGYEWDDIWGYMANVFIVNKTEKTLMFSADDVSLNGYMVEPYFAVFVSGGKSAFESITWSEAALEENNITEVDEIELTLSVYDWNDWTADDIVNETFVLNP